MAKLVFDRIVTPEEIMDILQKNLGSTFRVEIKKNNVQIVQDLSKGCLVLCQEKDNRTTVELIGGMPSGGLRAAIILGVMILLVIIGWRLGFLIIGVGVIPVLISIFLMKIPSQSLVGRIEDIFEKIAHK